MKEVMWIPDTLYDIHIAALKESQKSERISRICLHDSVESELHVMLISCAPNAKYPMHKHEDTDEWFYIVDGQLTIYQKSSSTDHVRSLCLEKPGAPSKDGGPIGHLIHRQVWHSTEAGSQGAVYLEVKTGPFAPEATTF